MAQARKRVLLVDDNLNMLKFLKIYLRIHGFDVITAETGKEGLVEVTSGEPDIMLLDIQMPRMNGFEVLRQLREFSKLPVIACSANPEYSGQALQYGADAFLSKPFDRESLINLIQELTN